MDLPSSRSNSSFRLSLDEQARSVLPMRLFGRTLALLLVFPRKEIVCVGGRCRKEISRNPCKRPQSLPLNLSWGW